MAILNKKVDYIKPIDVRPFRWFADNDMRGVYGYIVAMYEGSATSVKSIKEATGVSHEKVNAVINLCLDLGILGAEEQQ